MTKVQVHLGSREDSLGWHEEGSVFRRRAGLRELGPGRPVGQGGRAGRTPR